MSETPTIGPDTGGASVDEDESKGLQKVGDQLRRLTLGTVENGVGPITGSRTYAEDRLGHTNGDVEKAVKRVVRESVAAAATNGFVTGVGGMVLLPVTIPANVAGSLIINARMVGAVAHLRGYDLDDPHTQAMLMLTVAGSSAQSAAAAIGVKAGQQIALQTIKNIPIQTLREINKKVGFYLVTKYGTQRSAITLVKFVPGVGGIVGGGVDATLTRGIGTVAKKVFPSEG